MASCSGNGFFPLASGWRAEDFSLFHSNYLLPFNALVLCIVAGWLMEDKLFEVFKNKFVKTVLKISLKFIVPVVLLMIILGIK